MDDSFDAFDFARFAWGQWRVFAICCGLAVTLAGVVSVLLPRQYTATASLVIEPPAGNDPRAATVISPVYLESLKTYERIASNDTLFVQALERFHLRQSYSGVPVATLKRRMLKVSKPAGTKVLEISVTLRDARQAREMVAYLADQTVAASKASNGRLEEEITSESRSMLAAARARLQSAEQARDDFIKSEPVQRLEGEVANATRLQAEVRGELARTRGELAYYNGQGQAGEGTAARETGWYRTQAAGLQARAAALEQQDRIVTQQLQLSATLLEGRKGRREMLEAELRSARNDYEAANSKLNDIRASVSFRGERLDIIDPGVVPEQPSFPNVPLNLALALLASLVASSAYVAVRYGHINARAGREVHSYSRR